MVTSSGPAYRLLVRDPSLRVVAEIDQYLSCTLQPRFNGLGSWVLELAADTEAAAALGDGCGLVAVRNGVVVLSGPMVRREDRGDDEGDFVVASGYDDTIHLSDRFAAPCAWPYTAQDADVRAGAAESVITAYVAANAIAGGAWTGAVGGYVRDAVAGLAAAPDQGRGAFVTGRARFVNLLDLLTDLALSGGDLGFRVTQSLAQTGVLSFEVYVPTDRSATAVFSREMGNLRGYEYVSEAPTGNAITTAGQGQGTARQFRARVDFGSIATHNRRIEIFVDRRDTATVAELDQTGDEELSRRADRGQLKLSPIDTEGLSFMGADAERSYALGDRVTVMVRGVPVSDIVREVRIVLSTDGGEEVEPVVGTPGAMLAHTDTYVLRHLHRRLSLQERQ